MKIIKYCVDKVKDMITKETNDWKGAVRTLRTRLEEADFTICPNRVETKELTVEEINLFRGVVTNGTNSSDSVKKMKFTKQFTNITFVDSVGIERTWKANGHLTKADIIDWLMDKKCGLYSKYVAASYTTHRKDKIIFRIEHLELPTVVTDTGEEITEVYLVDDDLDKWDKLIRDNVIVIKNNITMPVQGTKYIMDSYFEKKKSIA